MRTIVRIGLAVSVAGATACNLLLDNQPWTLADAGSDSSTANADATDERTRADAGMDSAIRDPDADATADTFVGDTFAPDATDAPTAAGVPGVTPATLDFSLVPCGSAAAAKKVIIANTGSASFTFTATLAKGGASPYTLSATSGTVPPGSPVEISVAPRAIPQTAAITPNLFGDTLTITTNAALDPPHVVDLRMTAQGAILSLGSSTVDFGKRQVGTNPTLPLAVMNNGNIAAAVTMTVASPFGASPAPLNVTASGSALASISYAPDPKALATEASGLITLSSSGAICGAMPTATLTGVSFDRAKTLVGSAGQGSTPCVVSTSGLTYCWGRNDGGQLGDGTKTNRNVPTLVSNLSTVTALATSGWSCAAETAAAMCWGPNGSGNLGNGTLTESLTPTRVSGSGGWTAMALGTSHACAINDGVLRCWGDNQVGQLGTGSAGGQSTTPVAVSGNLAVTGIAASSYSTCALTALNTVYCWGRGSAGTLGNGGTSDSAAPLVVSGLNNASAIAMGYNGACAVQSGGSVVCWGSIFGFSSQVPAAVAGINDAAGITVGADFACAVRSGGGIVCWGYNVSGQLGNNSTQASNTPVSVVGIGNAVAVSATYRGTCAMLLDGTVSCWGGDTYGELGNGQTGSQSLVPVAVAGFN